MEKLKEEIKIKKLSFDRYFIEAFKIVKDLLKNDRDLLTPLAILTSILGIIFFIWSKYFMILVTIDEAYEDVAEDYIAEIISQNYIIFIIMLLVVIIASIGIYYYLFAIRKRIIAKLSNSEEISGKKLLIKLLILFIIGISAVIIMYNPYTIAITIPIMMFCSIPLLIVHILYLLYFDLIYLSRNKGLIESVKHSAKISKNNRLLIIGAYVVYNFGYQMIGGILILPVILGFIIHWVLGGLLSFVYLFVCLLSTIYKDSILSLIYVNVENLYFKENNQINENEISSNLVDNNSENNLENNLVTNNLENSLQNSLLIKRTTENDVTRVMEIIEGAKEEIKNLGIDQWQNGYPNENTIKNDISRGEAYILEENGKIVATAMLSFEGEPTYNNIEEGNWITNDKYGVIHRIAVDNSITNKGYASKLLYKLEQICKKMEVYSVKIDTHEGNIPMQKLLEKNGYQYCGIIYLEETPTVSGKRLAFEKVLNK